MFFDCMIYRCFISLISSLILDEILTPVETKCIKDYRTKYCTLMGALRFKKNIGPIGL